MEVQQQAAETLEQARLLLERSKRKRKKRRKRKLPKTSSLRRPCAHAARVPAVLRRVSTGPRCSASLSVWTRWTVARSSSFLAVACVMLVWLVTMHLALCSLLASPGPGCSASWPLWTRRTQPRQWLCSVGFPGDFAPRVVFPSVVWPRLLCIMAGYGPDGQLRGEILAHMVPMVPTAENWIFHSCSSSTRSSSSLSWSRFPCCRTHGGRCPCLQVVQKTPVVVQRQIPMVLLFSRP